jgi:hypothetical protein
LGQRRLGRQECAGSGCEEGMGRFHALK